MGLAAGAGRGRCTAAGGGAREGCLWKWQLPSKLFANLTPAAPRPLTPPPSAPRDVLRHCMDHPSVSVRDTLDQDAAAYRDAGEVVGELRRCYDSLVATGDEHIAHSNLLDVLRQATTFGLHLARLDIRQESTKHDEAWDTITSYLGLGSYKAWTEEQRMEFLLRELTGKRPLLPPTLPMSAEVADVIGCFRMLAELPPDSLGAYIISMAHTASDVLAVTLLQRECGGEGRELEGGW